jgi:hypothetical protein
MDDETRADSTGASAWRAYGAQPVQPVQPRLIEGWRCIRPIFLAGMPFPKTKSSRRRFTRYGALAVALVGLGLLVAACGGGSASPGIASLGSTTTTTQTSSAQTAGSGGSTASKYKAALKYVDCMRSHGVSNFPDPASDGQINVNFATGGKDGSPVSSGINRNSSQYISAARTCQHLRPGGVPTPAQNQQALARELRFAHCMQSHGVSNFPDPTNAGVVHLIGVDQNSPQYQSAQKACAALVPGVYSK